MKHIDLHKDTIISSIERKYFYSDRDYHLAKNLLRRYLRGERVCFNMRLCLDSFSTFTRKVLQKIREIPYGEKRSYSWVAEEVGLKRGSRAVGQALKRNPLTIIIPCHRIIKKDGKIGGFSKGVMLKKELLEMEENVCKNTE